MEILRGNMNKTELIDSLAARADLPKAAASRILESFIEIITESLSKGDPVALVGFGTFVVSQRKQRAGRNPKTGNTITIPSANVPRFRAGKQLKEKVNNK